MTEQKDELITNDNLKKQAEAPSSVIPNDVQSAVNKMAKNKPEKLLEFMAMEMSSGGNPLHHKMTPEHISQVLNIAEKHDERQYELHKSAQGNNFADSKSNRRYCFAAFIMLSILTCIILFLFKDKTDVLIPILTGLGGLASGFLGGWGLGKRNT